MDEFSWGKKSWRLFLRIGVCGFEIVFTMLQGCPPPQPFLSEFLTFIISNGRHATTVWRRQRPRRMLRTARSDRSSLSVCPSRSNSLSFVSRSCSRSFTLYLPDHQAPFWIPGHEDSGARGCYQLAYREGFSTYDVGLRPANYVSFEIPRNPCIQIYFLFENAERAPFSLSHRQTYVLHAPICPARNWYMCVCIRGPEPLRTFLARSLEFESRTILGLITCCLESRSSQPNISPPSPLFSVTFLLKLSLHFANSIIQNHLHCSSHLRYLKKKIIKYCGPKFFGFSNEIPKKKPRIFGRTCNFVFLSHLSASELKKKSFTANFRITWNITSQQEHSLLLFPLSLSPLPFWAKRRKKWSFSVAEATLRNWFISLRTFLSSPQNSWGWKSSWTIVARAFLALHLEKNGISLHRKRRKQRTSCRFRYAGCI